MTTTTTLSSPTSRALNLRHDMSPRSQSQFHRRQELERTEPPEPPPPPDPPPDHHTKAHTKVSPLIRPRLIIPPEFSVTASHRLRSASSLFTSASTRTSIVTDFSPSQISRLFKLTYKPCLPDLVLISPPIPPDPPPSPRPLHPQILCLHPASPYSHYVLSLPKNLFPHNRVDLQNKILQATTIAATSLIESQFSQPPASISCYGNRRASLLDSEFSTADKPALPHHCTLRSRPKDQMGHSPLLLFLGLSTSKTTKAFMKKHETYSCEMMMSTNDNELSQSSSLHMVFKSYALQASITPTQALDEKQLQSFSLSEALALKAAVEAASRVEIHHLRVFSDSHSLVSQIISNGDVNELKSVLHDIRCLLETFSFIYVSFNSLVMYSAS